MANNCEYSMQVKGTKENVQTFINRMTCEDSDSEKCFRRVFECISEAEEYEDVNDANSYYAILYGDCAWSLESCCRESGYAGVDLFAINTKELNLKLEAWSREDGCEFEEHYIYDNGECLCDDCVETIGHPYWDKVDFPNFDDFIEEYGLEDKNLSESDFDEYGEYIGEFNGFGDEWGSWQF